jgi:hypothetical protein
MSTTSNCEGNSERFPDLRLATAIIESPRTVVDNPMTPSGGMPEKGNPERVGISWFWAVWPSKRRLPKGWQKG